MRVDRYIQCTPAQKRRGNNPTPPADAEDRGASEDGGDEGILRLADAALADEIQLPLPGDQGESAPLSSPLHSRSEDCSDSRNTNSCVVPQPQPQRSLTFNHSTVKKRKRGGRSGPDYRVAPGEPSAVTRALKTADSRPNKEVFFPAIGTEFNSCEEAKEFYNMYSWEVGFGIRCGKSKRNGNQYWCWNDFVCSCEGFDRKQNSSSCRTGCKAKIRLHRTEDDGWFVSTLVTEHNHPLSLSYHEKQQWGSHGVLDPTTKSFIKNLRENNVSLGKVCSILNCDAELSSVPAFRKGVVKSVCGKLSQDKMKDDIGKTVALLEEMKASDPTLAVSLDIDHDGTIKNMMWCTGKNKIDYTHFGDAVTFDTTYRTNLYKMPFGLFVGVNNHFQTVVFAGVLMTHETTEAFEWVFSTFARLMGNRPPLTILTDQASAMAAALKSTWRHTKHRWCRWHVLRNAKPKIGKKYTKYSGFKAKFHWLISRVMSPQMFEEEWEDLVVRYKLQKNKFLKRIFRKREKWAKPYFLNVFCAGMTSTQRSESANHMLKAHIPRESPMHLFVRKYNSFLKSRAADEGPQEFATKQKSRTFRIGVPIERDARAIYTKAMFEKFQDELFKSGSFMIERVEDSNNYILCHAINGGGDFRVSLNSTGTKVDCSCGMMTHFGMPCRHALKVLVHLDVNRIPTDNILTRWTVKGGSNAAVLGSLVNREGMETSSEAFMHNTLWLAARRLVENGKSNTSAFEAALSILDNGCSKVEELAREENSRNKSVCGVTDPTNRASFFEITKGAVVLGEVPVNVSCPPRMVKSGRPASSHLAAWRELNKARRGKQSSISKNCNLAEVDEESPMQKIKSLDEVCCVSKN